MTNSAHNSHNGCFVSILLTSAPHSQSLLLRGIHEALMSNGSHLQTFRAVKCSTHSQIHKPTASLASISVLPVENRSDMPDATVLTNDALSVGVNIGHNGLTEPYKTSCGKGVWSSMLQFQDGCSRSWTTVNVSKRGKYGHNTIQPCMCQVLVSCQVMSLHSQAWAWAQDMT